MGLSLGSAAHKDALEEKQARHAVDTPAHDFKFPGRWRSLRRQGEPSSFKLCVKVNYLLAIEPPVSSSPPRWRRQAGSFPGAAAFRPAFGMVGVYAPAVRPFSGPFRKKR